MLLGLLSALTVPSILLLAVMESWARAYICEE